MDTKPVEQYRAELTLPHSTHTITSNDLNQLQTQVRAACTAENIKCSFDNSASDSTIFVLDNTQQPLGQIATYEVHPWMSVSHLVGARKQAQRAA